MNADDAERVSLADYVAERDAMLLRGSVDELIAFNAKHNPETPPFPNREIAEISLHKCRTAAKSLPTEARQTSKQWLIERGYTPWDDGDV